MAEATPPLSTPGSSSSRSSSEDVEIPVQPAFFYPSGFNVVEDVDEDFLSPDQDPYAARGIPVFRPSLEEFQDFEMYMNKVELWGRKSGIVKVIPPKEWTDALPPIKGHLPDLRLRHPIEQHMLGQSGLFRQNNVEKRRILNLKDWAELCNKEELKAYPIENGAVKTRGLPRAPRKPRTSKKPKGDIGAKEEETSTIGTPAASLGDQAETTVNQLATLGDSTPRSPVKGELGADKSPGVRTPDNTVDPYYDEFDPYTSWLPENTRADDYTPEVCRDLERIFWRTCGLGTPPLYGADMAGSLFTDQTKAWNVAHLPSLLSRLCIGQSLPGVNTPYLYYGMWRATFAWHVEDMDLYSINYIHWGAPKYWYAIPSERSKAFEGVMKGFFPGEASECPQYLRHKAFLVSPTLLSQSSCRPNTLVQHQGEFVITFPRGYHAGFNLGFNCAESVNFALDNWVELGRKAGVCSCVGDSVRINVDELLDEAERQRNEGSTLPKKRAAPTLSSEQRSPKKAKAESAKPSQSGSATGEEAKPRIRLPALPPLPCCLCASSSAEGLLSLSDPPEKSSHIKPFVTKDAEGKVVSLWRAHEMCARSIPETWIDEVDGKKTVFGVDCVVKDRWALKCAQCTRPALKAHGAKIQCTKGKCPRAFHVSCAINAIDVVYKELAQMEKEVLLLDHSTYPVVPVPADGNGSISNRDGVQSGAKTENPTEPTHTVVRVVTKPVIELLCCNHNPLILEQRKKAKQESIRRDVLALQPDARIKIRNAHGVCEVTLTAVNEVRETVTVLWTDGVRREFSWRSILWGDVAEGTLVKTVGSEMEPAKTHRPATQLVPGATPTGIPTLIPGAAALKPQPPQNSRSYYPSYGYGYPPATWTPAASPGMTYAYGMPSQGLYYPYHPSYPPSNNLNATRPVANGTKSSTAGIPVYQAMNPGPGGPSTSIPAAAAGSSATLGPSTAGYARQAPYYPQWPAYHYPQYGGQYPYHLPQPQPPLKAQNVVPNHPTSVLPNN